MIGNTYLYTEISKHTWNPPLRDVSTYPWVLINLFRFSKQTSWIKRWKGSGSLFYALKRAQRGFFYIIAVWCASALFFLTMAANGHLLAQMTSFISAIFKRSAFFCRLHINEIFLGWICNPIHVLTQHLHFSRASKQVLITKSTLSPILFKQKGFIPCKAIVSF